MKLAAFIPLITGLLFALLAMAGSFVVFGVAAVLLTAALAVAAMHSIR